ncbi:S8 family peptidase [Arthrospira platensis]|uniref:S8 family peptidase n=1 Tax=Limnospira TaxID=2596745 RepID=UPI000291F696|nr:S8 family peptidase [Arthrospira platensis]MDT9297803.1 S8 family peptidase [Arthrospira platensis PCC 7345]MDT9310766.1 S8 family peptidase [Limnospira sp. Paracas R14]WAK74184.1 S8 family peptidase [Arthrospira sp. PCC 9108]
MSQESREFAHIYLPENGRSENYTRPRQGGGSKSPPNRDRLAHARYLEEQIGQAIQQANEILNSRDSQLATGVPGVYLEFRIKSEETIALKSLENRKKKVELVAVKKIPEQEGMVLATVFVPESAQDYFLKKVEQYRDENTNKENPKNEALVARLEAVQIGTVQSLFTDNPALFPENGREVWWEVWLRKGKQEGFKQITQKLEIPTKPHAISFPEREVVLAMSNWEAMARVINHSDAVAELRIAKDTPSMFLEMRTLEQAQWVDDLENRLLEPGKHAVSICVLDSGVTRIHPLLSPGLDANDMHTVEPSWGVNDSAFWHGHGTAMAGLCLYSDQLIDWLATSENVKLLHRIESVKILPNTGQNQPELYGAITEQGVSLPEIENPDRPRVFCLAVTSSIDSMRGTPSSWSAAVDQLCFNDGKFRRFMIISAGNIYQDILAEDYLNINDIETIENPGQAWNPLIVGAYTEKINIIDSNYQGWQPLAPGGDLSPRSRTSVTWDSQWPIRPDVVFEGGNMAFDQNPAESIDDLCLLTTHYRPNIRMFDRMSDTSSRMDSSNAESL